MLDQEFRNIKGQAFVVHTQCLENYGAHCESGKYIDDMAYWKFKWGDTFVVEGVERVQDAVAAVVAHLPTKSISLMEFPTKWGYLSNWLMQISNDYDEGAYEKERAILLKAGDVQDASF